MTTKYYEIGFGRTVAAEKANIAVSQLNSELVKHRVPSHHYNKALTPNQIETIKFNHQLGMTYKQLAKKHGMSISSMQRYCTM